MVGLVDTFHLADVSIPSSGIPSFPPLQVVCRPFCTSLHPQHVAPPVRACPPLVVTPRLRRPRKAPKGGTSSHFDPFSALQSPQKGPHTTTCSGYSLTDCDDLKRPSTPPPRRTFPSEAASRPSSTLYRCSIPLSNRHRAAVPRLPVPKGKGPIGKNRVHQKGDHGESPLRCRDHPSVHP